MSIKEILSHLLIQCVHKIAALKDKFMPGQMEKRQDKTAANIRVFAAMLVDRTAIGFFLLSANIGQT
jgi:hypothetical protein